MKELTNEEISLIIRIADGISEAFLLHFEKLSTTDRTSFLLGMVKTIAAVWASCASADPTVVFEDIMAARPLILKEPPTRYLQ